MRHSRKPTSLLLAALGCALAAAPASTADSALPRSLTVVKSHITVSGTSNLHEWKVSADALHASIKLPAGFLEGDVTTPPSGSFSLAATALKSDKSRMNHLMWDALRAPKHPQLVFDLRGARVKDRPDNGADIEAEGVLTVAGVARPTNLLLRVRRQGDRLTVAGELPVLMSDFGISPPTALLGTLKTGNKVVITIEATLADEGK